MTIKKLNIKLSDFSETNTTIEFDVKEATDKELKEFIEELSQYGSVDSVVRKHFIEATKEMEHRNENK